METFLDRKQHLFTEPLSLTFIQQRLGRYALAVKEKSRALEICVAFIDGTVIAISRPLGGIDQRVFYNGHKRQRAIKFQGVTAPDGLI